MKKHLFTFVLMLAVCSAMAQEAVDLGLSVKWADMNIGAQKPADAGSFAAWGEVETKNDFKLTNYVFKLDESSEASKTLPKDLKSIAGTECDFAKATLGGAWRMPTQEEFEELMSKCKWEWVSIDGVYGYKITATKAGVAGNSIFLPAIGCSIGKSVSGSGYRGYYWCATNAGEAYYARYMLFGSAYQQMTDYRKYYGLAVRPVCK